MRDHYEAIQSVLSKYLSPLNARGVLNRALSRANLTRHQMDDGNVAQVLGNIERAIRLFVEPGELVNLEKDLRELTGSSPAPESIRLPVDNEGDIVRARAAGRLMCEQLRASPFSIQKVATIVSELARNIVSYTKGGHIELAPKGGNPSRVLIVAADRGPGIDDLERIMSGKYRSKTGLGLGIVGSKRLADRFDIQSNRKGTTVEAEVFL